jgi:phosphoribosyl-AMP cyclohydrolase
MDSRKRHRLLKKGWKSGMVQEFLELSDEDAALIEIRARLAYALHELRTFIRLTQAEVARRMGI